MKKIITIGIVLMNAVYGNTTPEDQTINSPTKKGEKKRITPENHFPRNLGADISDFSYALYLASQSSQGNNISPLSHEIKPTKKRITFGTFDMLYAGMSIAIAELSYRFHFQRYSSYFNPHTIPANVLEFEKSIYSKLFRFEIYKGTFKKSVVIYGLLKGAQYFLTHNKEKKD